MIVDDLVGRAVGEIADCCFELPPKVGRGNP